MLEVKTGNNTNLKINEAFDPQKKTKPGSRIDDKKKPGSRTPFHNIFFLISSSEFCFPKLDAVTRIYDPVKPHGVKKKKPHGVTDMRKNKCRNEWLGPSSRPRLSSPPLRLE